MNVTIVVLPAALTQGFSDTQPLQPLHPNSSLHSALRRRRNFSNLGVLFTLFSDKYLPIVDKQPPKGRPQPFSLPARSGLSAPDCSLADRCLDSNTMLYLYSTPSSTSSSKDTARQQMCSPRALSTTRGLTATPWSRTPTSATRSPRPARRSQHAATRSAQPHWRDLLCASARHMYSARLLGTSLICSARLRGTPDGRAARQDLLTTSALRDCSPHLLATSALDDRCCCCSRCRSRCRSRRHSRRP